MNNPYIKNLFPIQLLICLALLLPGVAKALSPDFYAPSSALASGSWAKVQVSETGMQFISNATLRNLGFSDPSKVNVYGYGGRMLSERLDENMPDDLPPVPSMATNTGIIFFGYASIGWNQDGIDYTEYSHYNNPYSDKAFYFLSDRDDTRFTAQEASSTVSSPKETITVFTERIAHEQDLLAPSNTGRLMLGEDFRVQASRNFQFNLPDNTGDALVKVAFGAKSSSGSASLLFTANGESLPSTKDDQIASAAASRFIVTTVTVKNISNPGNKLNLGIDFSATGALQTAALDYIEVEYPRSIKLDNGELYFYVAPRQASTVTVEGCGAETIVWDITDPLHTKIVETSLNGSALSFNIPEGYAEFVAFNPASIKRNVTPAGKVQNQDLHSLPAPGMLVIAPDAYRNAAMRLAELHAKTDGLTVMVLSPEEVYNEFSSGNPDVTAFRKLLKMWYDRAEGREEDYTRFCLIMSRPTYDNKMVTPIVKNAGYPRVPIWQSPTGDTESSSYSTDDYVGMLADNLSELSIGNAKIHVAVGRMPVKSVSEAETAITKLENYLLNPSLGSWRNNVMIIADDQDNGVHLNQAEEAYEAMRSSGNGAEYLYEKLYLDSYPMVYTSTGATYPEAKQRMFDKINEGVVYIDYIGHANPSTWGHEGLLYWTDITSFSNTNLPFIYAATCEFLRWDDDAISGAEEMWLNPNAGVIGMICPSRTVLITANGVLNKATSQFVFMRDSEGKSMRVGDIMIKGKNAGQADSNKLRYGLIGDPSMRLPSPDLSVKVDRINDVELSDNSEFPELQALSSVNISGSIVDSEGAIQPDFNGVAEIQLFDAEKVITTYGNGEDGVESIYNDRKTRLYSGRVNVVDGKWATTVTMPFEIDNNYSPALISLYASDQTGREANGACEQLYVYGFNQSAASDFEGPEISKFYLNGPGFTSGDVVSPSPVLKARVSDPSGINLSEAGIGHSMLIALDGKTFFSDVARFYTPDAEDHTAGEITYPLHDMTAGDHTLEFTVWDNANNSSTATLAFTVSAAWLPEIETLTTDVNPATTSVNFIVGCDGVSGATKCLVEVFDLMGRKIWSSNSVEMSAGNDLRFNWDLSDSSGARVLRGIYLYRATVTLPNGATVTKAKKLAVS